MRLLPYILAACAFGQVTTPFKVSQSAGSSSGAVWLQEPRAGGVDWLKLRAGTLAADLTVTFPTADGTANQCLSTDGAGQWGWRTCSGAPVDLLTTDYDWYQTPGTSLTAATPATVTLTPCPAGVAPYIAHYSVRIAGGTGTAETVLVTAVSGSGATCDIDFTPANNHTGSWAIGSASDGIQETVNYAIANVGHRVFIPNGVSTVDPVAPGEDSTIYIQGPVWMVGQNQSVNGGAEIGLSYDDQWAIVVTTAAVNYPVKLENFAIQGTGLTSSVNPVVGATPSGGGIKITASSGHNLVSKIRDIQFYTLSTGLWCHKCAGTEITGNFFWGFLDYGIYLENTNNTDAGDYTITSNQFQVVYDGMTYTDATALHWASAGGAKIIANKFNLHGAGINMTFADPSIITVIEGNSFDNQRLPSVKLRAGPGVMTPIGFLGAVIANNVVTGPGESAYVAFDIGDNTTDYLANVTISGNTMQANDGTAIKIGDVQQVSVAGNVMGEFTTGIEVAATAVGFAHGKNVCYSVTTCYDIDAAADVRPTSPIFASGYGGWAASGTNIAAIAEFAPPATGEVNNAVLFQTNTTGTNSQRGIWWDTAANMHFARFSSDRATTHTNDLKLEADGDAHFSYNVGIGRTPPSGVALDVNGVIRSSDGTIINQLYTTGGAAYLGTQSNHSLIIVQDATERLRVTSTQLLPGLVSSYLYLGDASLRFNTLWTTNVDAAPSGTTGNFVRGRSFELVDAAGASASWKVSANATTGTSSINILDNSGSRWIRGYRALASTASNDTFVYANWIPNARSIAGGDAVDDAVRPNLGSLTDRWLYVFGNTLDGNNLTVRTGATSGYVLTSDASGNASWAATAACPTCIIDGGNTTGATLTIGTNDAQTLSLETNNTSYLQINSTGQVTIAGNVIPSGTRDIGATGNEWNELFVGSITATSIIEPKVSGGAQNGDAAKRWSNTYSVDGNYSGILTAGHTSAVVRLGQTLNVNYASDYAGAAINTWSATDAHGGVLDFNKSGSGTIGTHTAVVSGETLGFFVFRGSDGTAFQRGVEVNGEVDGTVSSGVVPGRLRIRTANTSGAMTERIRVDSAGLTTITGDLTVTGTCTGCGSSSLPVADTTNIIKGSADATKLLRFEVDGLTTATTRTLTPQNNSYTIAATDIAQTFSSTQTFSGTLSVTGTVGDDFIPSVDGTFTNGTTFFRWGSIATYNADFNGVLTFQSGTTFTGSILPTTNNLYAIGNSSFRLSNISTVNANFSGTLTAPSGSTGYTGTVTVRDAAGTGTCTNVYSGGLRTGGTC